MGKTKQDKNVSERNIIFALSDRQICSSVSGIRCTHAQRIPLTTAQKSAIWSSVDYLTLVAPHLSKHDLLTNLKLRNSQSMRCPISSSTKENESICFHFHFVSFFFFCYRGPVAQLFEGRTPTGSSRRILKWLDFQVVSGLKL